MPKVIVGFCITVVDRQTAESTMNAEKKAMRASLKAMTEKLSEGKSIPAGIINSTMKHAEKLASAGQLDDKDLESIARILTLNGLAPLKRLQAQLQIAVL